MLYSENYTEHNVEQHVEYIARKKKGRQDVWELSSSTDNSGNGR